jgi:hopanoid biosynthesis associated RND transporter like protein HpnN
MGASPVARVVGFCSRYSGLIVVATLLVAFAAGDYVRGHFAMNSRTEELISPQTAWRKREAVHDAAFPQQNGLIVAVVDGVTPERAEEGSAALANALAANKAQFVDVRRPDDGRFFGHDGLMLLSTAKVKETVDKLITAQPFLGALAIDPSLRGVTDNLSTALRGVEHGDTKLEDLDKPIAVLGQTLNQVNEGNQAFLSWRQMVTGEKPGLRETRRFIQMHPRLEYEALMPGARATQTIRDTAKKLGLTPENGVRVRLTGSVPMADDEFGSLTERARLMATLMMVAVLTMLWFALRSARLIFSVLLTVFVGLTMTTAIGLLAVGAFNLISVAFIALFVGLGVDFGIQFCVRYRAERHESGDLDKALRQTGSGVGAALALAAAATAAGFYSFLPTSYRGVAELGFVAGTGMLITFLLSITFLPALVKLLAPPGEPEEVGIRMLAPLDRILLAHKRQIVLGALIVSIVAAACLPWVKFDFNPLDLRNPHVESVATALDLMNNPDTSPNTLDVLMPSHEEAVRMAAKLETLPEVDHTITVDTFVPKEQDKKIALISEAQTLLDPTLNPFTTKPPPSDAEVKASFAEAAGKLRSAAGDKQTTVAKNARVLASALERLTKADRATLARAEKALVPGLNTMLEQVRSSLVPYPVSLKTLPQDLVRDWVSPNGLYRIEVYPKSSKRDNESLRIFTSAVRRVAPYATGEPILIQESGRTIVRAFIQAGVLSFIAITILLLWALRNVALVALALGPLLLSGIATLATCVLIDLQLNYANIIALPLLLGIGVAFDIYFVVAWRSGVRDLLGSALTRAIILSAGTTASAFGTLWISSHPGTASMGQLLAISLGWILITVLFLLPALLGYAVPEIGIRKPAPREAPRENPGGGAVSRVSR